MCLQNVMSTVCLYIMSCLQHVYSMCLQNVMSKVSIECHVYSMSTKCHVYSMSTECHVYSVYRFPCLQHVYRTPCLQHVTQNHPTKAAHDDSFPFSCDVPFCRLARSSPTFEGSYCCHLQVRQSNNKNSSTAKWTAVRCFKRWELLAQRQTSCNTTARTCLAHNLLLHVCWVEDTCSQA
jgi:hypothetical protein